jgi:hypothetical protein
MNKKIKTILVIFFVCFVGLTAVDFVFANENGGLMDKPGNVDGFESTPFSNMLNGIDRHYQYEDQFEGRNVFYYIGVVIKNFLGIVSAFLVVMVLYAGFLWMTAGGNQDQVTKARKWITNGVVGLIVTMSAFAITDYVFERVFTAQMSGVQSGLQQLSDEEPTE